MRHSPPKTRFAPLTLSAGQEEQYERLAHSLLKETVADYDHFTTHDRSVVDTARWKAVKRRDNIVVYKHRTRDASAVARGSSRGAATASMHINSAPPAYDERESEAPNPLAQTIGLTSSAFSITERSLQPERSHLPKLLAVGSIRGSLDDVMYGIASPNASSMRVKTSYVNDAIVDGAVLYELQGPSAAEPFRFLGIKWLLHEPRGAAKRFVRPRDVVVLEYCSIMLRPSGERIGFHVLHSIDVPACRDVLADRRVLRASVSSCFLYRERPVDGVVDVYMTATVEPRGHVLESMALRAAASAFSSCWQAVACAQRKKLAWLLQHDELPRVTDASARRRRRHGCQAAASHDVVQDASDSTKPVGRDDAGCSVCFRAFIGFATPSTCQLCDVHMCARCRVATTLSSELLDATLATTAMVFCTACIARVRNTSAAEIAMREIAAARSCVRLRGSSSSAATSVTRRSSSAITTASLYDDPRASERSTYASIFGISDDARSIGRTSSSASALVRRSSVQQSTTYRRSSSSGAIALPRPTLDLPRADEPPVLLTDRVRCGSLRAMDYIRPPTEGDDTTANATDDELESVAASSVDLESDTGRMSYTSSIALLDHDEYDDSDNDSVELQRFAQRHVGLDMRVDEGDETADENDNVDEPDSRAVAAVHRETSAARISQVHALVRAQSLGYKRRATVTSSQHSGFSRSDDSDDDVSDNSTHRQRARTQSYQMQLWMQMTGLRDAAESTYQVAKRTTETALQLAQQQQQQQPGGRNGDGVYTTASTRTLRTVTQPFQFHVVGLRAGRSMTTVTPPPATAQDAEAVSQV